MASGSNDTHPIGRLKAAFFGALGFGPDRVPDLVAASEAHTFAGRIVDHEPTPYGTKYVVDGELKGLRRTAHIRSVWIGEESGRILRMITAYPAPREVKDD